METQILKWKDMWQEQKSDSLKSNELIERLNQMEKNAKMQRNKLLVLSAITIIACTIWISEILTNTNYLLSYLLILAGVFVKLVPLYKAKYKIISSESDFNNRDYIKKLTQKMNFNNTQLLMFMTIMIVALNFALLGLYNKGTIFNYEINDENRIYFHLATLLLFIVAYINNKRVLDTSKRKTVRLIADLEDGE